MGKLIVIEGLDGSGKETQSKLLYKRMKKNGYKVMLISFPRYDKESSTLVKMYLQGDFGDNPNEISPYISSTFYAADRYASFKREFEDFYNAGGIVIADRYTTSNMVHQGGKIKSNVELVKFLDWLWNFEYKIYQLPVPDRVYFLDISLELIIKRIEERASKMTNSQGKDIHEKNLGHLYNAHKNANRLIELYKWNVIECTAINKILSAEEIHDKIYFDVLKLVEGDG